jgi:hypothetical protein
MPCPAAVTNATFPSSRPAICAPPPEWRPIIAMALRRVEVAPQFGFALPQLDDFL